MNVFPDSLKRLGLAFSLILLAALMLLWSDRHSRHVDRSSHGAQVSARIPVALLQHSSNPLLDETRQGLLDEMAAHGFREGETISLTTYNPEGDLPTGNLMAQKIAGGQDKLAISISTVMLQAMASANRAGRVKHVFGAVTSPVGAGVGIKALDSLDKPPYLTGIGTPQPVGDIFRLAKRINPELKTVGVVWNPAEVNSEICTQRAREVAGELGMTLLEAPVVRPRMSVRRRNRWSRGARKRSGPAATPPSTMPWRACSASPSPPAFRCFPTWLAMPGAAENTGMRADWATPSRLSTALLTVASPPVQN
ncbi:MAG: ABC transporter substrate-binding protein, partial [Methylococcus sp.]